MPARLVYSPKAYVFTKNSAGDVLNLTNYTTAGQVQRLINQPSTANVTLRNPGKMFTVPSNVGGPSFHPMDGITIFLERLRGFPVQVFTGYLDDTPYYQMYPGTITLQATCTLKRLLYTFWDPSLPYVNAFLAKFGWINFQGANGLGLVNTGALTTGKGIDSTLQDGSIGKLLWATLTDIGDWHDTHVWIENIPADLAKRIAKLASALSTSTDAAENEWTLFMQKVIGSGSFGSGGGPGGGSGTGSGTGSGQAWLVPASAESDPPGANAACGPLPADRRGYSVLSVSGTSGDAATAGQALSPGTVWPCSAQLVITNPQNGKSVTVKHVDNGAGSDGILPVVGLYPQTQSDLGLSGGSFHVIIQGVSGSPTLQPVRGTKTSQTTSAVSSINSTVNQITSTIGSTGSTTGSTSIIHGTNQASGPSSNSNGVINPIPGFGGFTFDFGIDASAPAGSAVLAPAACTVAQWIPNFYQQASDGSGGLLLLKFDQSLANAPTQYWYISEHVLMSSTTVGHHFSQGDTVATFGGQGGGSGIEIGWGVAPTGDPRYGASLGIVDHSSGVWGQNFQNFFSIGGGSPQQGGSTGTAGGGTSTGTVLSQSNAQAFTAELDFPSVQDMTTAMILGGERKGLMHDQPLLQFVQQLTQASLRAFQSLPNGDFFAFYPDYFGETSHRKPYWNVYDIEVLQGGINLSDAALVTHQFAVGDNTYPLDNNLINMMFSAGAISVFNAFLDPSSGGLSDVMTKDQAIAFVKRYGARPNVANYPMVRSSLFEMYLAYQQFMLAWSNQFRTPFSFTFMPELFPGGKVAFPDHGLQMYINSVTHTWDYAEAGFQTTAVLSAPAAMAGSTNPDLPPDMVKALVGPVKVALAKGTTNAKSPPSDPLQQQAQQAAQTVDTGVQTIVNQILNFL